VADSLRLTPRELDVVQGVFDNGTEASIAKQLRLSTHTVHAHLDRLYRKLRVSNRTALTLRVFTEILACERAHRAPSMHPDMTGAIKSR
jgi:DNA-binding NarL/FixJ family response regulator